MITFPPLQFSIILICRHLRSPSSLIWLPFNFFFSLMLLRQFYIFSRWLQTFPLPQFFTIVLCPHHTHPRINTHYFARHYFLSFSLILINFVFFNIISPMTTHQIFIPLLCLTSTPFPALVLSLFREGQYFSLFKLPSLSALFQPSFLLSFFFYSFSFYQLLSTPFFFSSFSLQVVIINLFPVV